MRMYVSWREDVAVVDDIIKPTCSETPLLAWGGTATPICSQCIIIEFVTSVLNVLSLSYDTHSPRWCIVCSREALQFEDEA